MTRIDLVAIQQRLAQQQPKPVTPVPAEPPSWSTRPAPESALRTTPAPKAHPAAASAAAPAGTLRATTTMRGALPLKATKARAERAEERARAKALRAQIDELNAEVVVMRAEADRELAEEQLRADRLGEQVEALSAKVVRAEKQAEAAIGRAERAEAGRNAERARAEALRTSIDELRAEQAMMAEIYMPASSSWPSTTPWRCSRRVRSCAGPRGRAEGEGACGAAQVGVEGRMSGQGAPSLLRYPSTADAAPPTPGAWCSSCFGIRWWTVRHEPKGWRCGTCHPSADADQGEGGCASA